MRLVAILCLLFVLGPSPASGEDEPADVEELLRELDALDSVAGKSVGFGGGESGFYKVYRRLLDADGEKLPEQLLESSSPIRRSMGLVLIVARDGEKAVPVLRRRLNDRAPVTVNPFGCARERGSVGVVARALLGHRDWIADHSRVVPLLTKEELLAIDLDLLGRDDTVLHHEHLGEDVLIAIDDGKLPLDLAVLRERYPALPALRLVKGLGRLRGAFYAYPSPQQQIDRWVFGLATDLEQPIEIRLAAASALCHWRPVRGEDISSPRALPARVLTGLSTEAVAVIRRDCESCRQVRLKGARAPAAVAGHALLAEEIRNRLNRLKSNANEGMRLPDRTLKGLLRFSERFGEWQPEWNAFGDGLYVLEAAVEEFGDRLKKDLGAEAYDLVMKRMRVAIAADG